MDYGKKFMVEPGAKVRLSKIDASYSGKHETHEKAVSEIQANVERMGGLQYLLYADASQSLLVVLQALDAAGKDGVIRHGGARKDGSPRDVVMYSILAHEWPDVRRHLESRLRRHGSTLVVS